MTKEELDAINSAKKACQHGFYVNTGEASYDTRRLSLLIDVLNRTEAERDRWKARSEALERAIITVAPTDNDAQICCAFCVYGENGSQAEHNCLRCLNISPGERGNWQFDEARFTGGE